MLYRLVLFPVTLSDPNYPKRPHFSTCCIAFHILVMSGVELETSNLVGRLTVASAIPGIANHP